MPGPTPDDCPQFRVKTFAFPDGIPECLVGVVLVDLRTALHDLNDPPATGSPAEFRAAVRYAVLATPGAMVQIEHALGQALALREYNNRRNFITTVLIGCEDGKRRCVAIADEVAAALEGRGFRVEIEHLHKDPSADPNGTTAALDTITRGMKRLRSSALSSASGRQDQAKVLGALYDDANREHSVLGMLSDLVSDLSNQFSSDGAEPVVVDMDEAAAYIADYAGLRIELARKTITQLAKKDAAL